MDAAVLDTDFENRTVGIILIFQVPSLENHYGIFPVFLAGVPGG